MLNVQLVKRLPRRAADWLIVVTISTWSFGDVHGQSQDAEQKQPPSLTGELGAALREHNSAKAYGALSRIVRQQQSGAVSDQVADELLALKSDLVANRDVLQLLDRIVAEKKPQLAAKLLARVALFQELAHVIEANGAEHARKPTLIAVGQVLVKNGKLDPTAILAQMPIFEEGYFASEVGTLERPLCFRSHGYEDLDVPLKESNDGILNLGQVTLKPLAKEQQVSLKGKVTLDDPANSELPVVSLTVLMGPVNTTNNGYEGRMRWPDGIKAQVSETGEFEVTGLNPSEYTILVTAKGHVEQYQKVKLTAGQETDMEMLRLFSSDVGFYIGKPTPTTGELAWEADFDAALKRAESEKKPLLVMLTATWCGPCKLLEEQTLNDAWIRYFLSPFVVVKAYEDRNVEKRYGTGSSYPTLVFADRTGKAVHHCKGNMSPLNFVVHCVQALKAMSMEVPPEIETLIEKRVIKLP